VVVEKDVTCAQISFDGGYGVAHSVCHGHASSSMVVRPPDLKKFILGVEGRKNSYREALIRLRKANHDSVGSLDQDVSSEEEGLEEYSPRFPAVGDCHTTNMAVGRAAEGVM
jgi:hypothetical protein